MKGKAKKVFGYLSLFIAITMVVGGAMGYAIMGSEPETEVVMKEVQRTIMVNDTNRQERIDNAEYDEDVDYATGSEIAEARQNYTSTIEDYGIGSIYIPKGDMSVPLLAGTSEWNLFNGVATGRPDQELGKGLFVGLSHNLINDTLIKRIDKMESGDMVYATDFTDVYIYQTVEQEVVHETDSTYFREPDEEETPKMLLYRCEGTYGTEWRRVVYADYITKQPIEDVDESILKGLNVDVDAIKKGESDKVEKEVSEFVEVEQKVEKEPKIIFEKGVAKLVGLINQYEWLSNFFLSVYKSADNHPFIFGLIAIALFAIYGIL